MDLPEKLKFRALLIQGGAFKAKLPKDPYPRYYFVLNLNPQKDEQVILLTSTTHFDLHRSCDGGDDVHIPLGPKEYENFTEECLICCNRPKQIFKNNLITQLESQKYQLLDHLPREIVKRIVEGIAKSNVVAPIVKTLVVGENKGNCSS